jgi:hypothetical protein
MGTATMALKTVMMTPLMMTFHQVLNKPYLAQRPATMPMTAATGEKAAATGEEIKPPDQVGEQAGQTARPGTGEDANEDGADGVEEDGQFEQGNELPNDDVEHDGDCHQDEGDGGEIFLELFFE